MLRIRRYRFFLIFTAIVILSIFHFGPPSDWALGPKFDQPINFNQSPQSDISNSKQHDSSPTPHGVPSEAKPPAQGGASDKNPIDKIEKPLTDLDPATMVAKPSTPATTVSMPELADSKPPKIQPETLPNSHEYKGTPKLATPTATEPPIYWTKLPEHFPVPDEELIKLPTDQPKSLPKLQANFRDESPTEEVERLKRLDMIRDAFQHSWMGYKLAAMGHDEIRPVSGRFRDPFAGWGATLVDSLDTLWIMGLRDDFSEAVDEVKEIDFTTTFRRDIPLFETVIRYLGGLIGAYDVSGHGYSILLEKAVELAEVLMGAFDTPNRMPMTFYYWRPDDDSPRGQAGRGVVLAELGSLSVEFTRLAQLTGENKYYDAIARITNELEKVQNSTRVQGMWPHRVDASGCKPTPHRFPARPSSLPGMGTDNSGLDQEPPGSPRPPNPKEMVGDRKHMEQTIPGNSDSDSALTNRQLTSRDVYESPNLSNNCERQGITSSLKEGVDRFGLGGMSDSTYEYLLKEYILLGGVSKQYQNMYEQAMNAVRKYLLFRPMTKEDRDIRFVAEVAVWPSVEEAEPLLDYEYGGTHLTCFAGGMIGIAAKLFEIDGDMRIAAQLTDGCVWAYESTATGIMPEIFELLPCEDAHSCIWNETQYRMALDPNVMLSADFTERLREKRISKHLAEQASEKGEYLSTEAVLDGGSHELSSTVSAVPIPTFIPPDLSYDEYIDIRIKEERLPPGFVSFKDRKYLLRPEAIESVFIMFRLTGDPTWREKGWTMFEAINKHTRTKLAYSSIKDVSSAAPVFGDTMESFWLAETLKYSYLLFSDPSTISLDEYVFNTEAHPFKLPRT